MSSETDPVFNPWDSDDWDDEPPQKAPQSSDPPVEKLREPEPEIEKIPVATNTEDVSPPVPPLQTTPQPSPATPKSTPPVTPEPQVPVVPTRAIPAVEPQAQSAVSLELDMLRKKLEEFQREKSTSDHAVKNNVSRIQQLEEELARMNEQLKTARPSSPDPADVSPPLDIPVNPKPSPTKPADNAPSSADKPKISNIFRKDKR